MTDKQPNALRLADLLEEDPTMWGGVSKVAWPAAAELRRLHALNQELLNALVHCDGLTAIAVKQRAEAIAKAEGKSND